MGIERFEYLHHALISRVGHLVDIHAHFEIFNLVPDILLILSFTFFDSAADRFQILVAVLVEIDRVERAADICADLRARRRTRAQHEYAQQNRRKRGDPLNHYSTTPI